MDLPSNASRRSQSQSQQKQSTPLHPLETMHPILNHRRWKRQTYQKMKIQSPSRRNGGRECLFLHPSRKKTCPLGDPNGYRKTTSKMREVLPKRCRARRLKFQSSSVRGQRPNPKKSFRRELRENLPRQRQMKGDISRAKSSTRPNRYPR